MSPLYWILLLALASLWGGGFLLIEAALEGFAPLSVAFWRVALASATLFTIALLRGERPPRDFRLWLSFAALGLLSNVLPFLLISWAQQTISPCTAATLCALTPLFTLVVARCASSREPLTPSKLVAITLGLGGVLTVALPGNPSAATPSALALAAVMAAALSYAGGSIVGKRFAGHSPLLVAACMLGCSTLLLAPVVVVQGSLLPTAALTASILAVVGLAEGSTALGFVVYFAILRGAGPIFLSWISFLVPIATGLLTALWFRKVPEPAVIAAAVLIIAGLLVLQFFPSDPAAKKAGAPTEAAPVRSYAIQIAIVAAGRVHR
ncbi:MAG: DMT family transporter [Puniceicoccaceae bacterium]|nr:MAG: DMT family transporter [Puniceicoccaceae bacterium]